MASLCHDSGRCCCVCGQYSAWYALANERDRNHEAACHFMQGRYRLVTTNFVIDETITLVLTRKDYRAALDIGN